LSRDPKFNRKKYPAKNGKIFLYRVNRLDELARKCLLLPHQFMSNMQGAQLKYIPEDNLE